MSEQPHDIEQHVARLAEALGETAPKPVSQIRNIVEILGVDFADELLRETQVIEAQGGMLLEKKNRRRTTGGVFFYLVRKRLTSAQRRKVFPKQKRPADQRPRRKKRAAKPLTDLPQVLQELTGHYGKASTVKITVIGRPSQVVERGDVTIFGLINDKAPPLPKNLPAPPQQTKYLVLVAKKQWNKVSEAIKAPDDVLIIEGYPAYEPRHAGITVYALSVTTKHIQATKREAQRSQVGS
ncbi:MAG TPA: phosphorylated adapter RNA export RNA-binding domain-containing protein [Herpetosiphonaceae bacterium]